LSTAVVDTNRIRLLAFSMSGSEFLGSSGTIVNLEFNHALLQGNYQIAAENAILADSSAQNILTSIINCNLYVDYTITQDLLLNQFKTLKVYNFPNPFNPCTKIELSLEEASEVHIKIYNIKGKLINEIKNHMLPAGKNIIDWDGKNFDNKKVSTGQYFYIIKTNFKTFKGKMLLLK